MSGVGTSCLHSSRPPGPLGTAASSPLLDHMQGTPQRVVDSQLQASEIWWSGQTGAVSLTEVQWQLHIIYSLKLLQRCFIFF